MKLNKISKVSSELDFKVRRGVSVDDISGYKLDDKLSNKNPYQDQDEAGPMQILNHNDYDVDQDVINILERHDVSNEHDYNFSPNID